MAAAAVADTPKDFRNTIWLGLQRKEKKMHLRPAFILVLALVCVAGWGCERRMEMPLSVGPPLPSYNTAKPLKAGQGLNLRVLSFNWRYLKPTDQIKVSGWAQNLTGKALQGTRILAKAFDEQHRPLGQGESFLRPTYLKHGDKARFDFYLNHGAWVKALHLRYEFETRQ